MKQNYQGISSFTFVKNNLRSLCALFLLSAGVVTTPLSAQVTYSFTTAGATGSVGPTQPQINTAYAATNLNGGVTGLAGIQSWTVPSTGLYRIDVAGASGGNQVTSGTNTGGLGSRLQGDFAFSAGDVIKILVGQKGTNGGNTGAGGGATYVELNGTLLIAAGGGGGATSDNNAANSTTLTSGTNDFPGGMTLGGTAGGGGLTCNSTSGSAANHGGGGGGYTGNGAMSTSPLCGCGGGGRSFSNGGTGGAGPVQGGFGGGGAASTTAHGGGGGGGGYSGGAGGQQVNYCTTGISRSGGGGGGSYNAGSNQANTAGVNTGDGFAMFSTLCNLNITATSSLICAGTSVTLTSNSVGTYSWSNGTTNSLSIVVTPASTTTYSISGEGTVPAGCLANAFITVTVNTTPTVTINSSTTSACLGQSVTLTASGANTYTWNNGVVNGVSFAPSATTLYTVTGTNACGTSTAGVTVTISALPVTAATTSSLVCAGSPATLTTGGATTYTWLPGTGTQTAYVVNPTANTIYTVTGKTGNCSGVATITVNTNPLPSMTIAPSSTAICYGNTATLSILGNATSYTWSVNGQMIPSIVINPTTTTVYSIIGINGFNCTRSVSQIIAVNPNPVVNINVSNPEVCSGGASTLTASGTNTYTWGGGINTASNVVNPTTASVYSVTGTNTLTGCFTTTQAAVSVFEPEISVTANTVICKGSNVVIGATGAITYTWVNGGQQNQNITVSPTVSTTYTIDGLVVNPANGVVCPASNTIDVVVNPLPVITASSSTPTICRGSSATITASGAGATGTYTWTNSLGNNPMITVSPILNQTYNVSGTDANGCRSTGTVQLLVITCNPPIGFPTIAANSANLLIYPNPSNGEFTISSDQTITLNIVNELGQQVKVISLTAKTPDVKVTNLANGIYFISGENENGSVKQKIVITK